MNILPFVSIFLILLATLSYSALDQSRFLTYREDASLGHLRAQRKLLSKLQSIAFDKIPTKKTTSDAPKTDQQPKKTQKPPRLHGPSKFNLYPLLQPECPKILQESALNILYKLYSSCASREALKDLLEEILTIGKEKISTYKKDNLPLSSLTLIDLYSQKHAALFYKLLKGTHEYDLNHQEGYPSLLEFFTLQEQKHLKVLDFPSLPAAVLEGLFGKNLTVYILEEEHKLLLQSPQRPNLTLNKEELLTLLHEHDPASSYNTLIEHLDFSLHTTKSDKIIAFDTSTAILVERKK